MILVNGIEVAFKQFPNGETLLVAESITDCLAITDVGFKYETDADLMKLLFVKNFLNQQQRGEYSTLTIYYMPYSRMDRSENGSPFTLKYIANFINGLKFKKVKIIEPHSDVTCALIDNSEAIYINFDLVKRVKKAVAFNDEKDYIVFPDAGASKRYSKMKAKNTLFCNKVRDFDTGEIKSLDLVGDTSGAYGKTAIIVDDLSSFGRTFNYTADRLKEEGFVEIILLVAHAENSIFKGELFEHVDKVFTTDSILTEQNHWGNKTLVDNGRLTIYPLAETLK